MEIKTLLNKCIICRKILENGLWMAAFSYSGKIMISSYFPFYDSCLYLASESCIKQPAEYILSAGKHFLMNQTSLLFEHTSVFMVLFQNTTRIRIILAKRKLNHPVMRTYEQEQECLMVLQLILSVAVLLLCITCCGVYDLFIEGTVTTEESYSKPLNILTKLMKGRR